MPHAYGTATTSATRPVRPATTAALAARTACTFPKETVVEVGVKDVCGLAVKMSTAASVSVSLNVSDPLAPIPREKMLIFARKPEVSEIDTVHDDPAAYADPGFKRNIPTDVSEYVEVPGPHARHVAELVAPIEAEYLLAPHGVHVFEAGLVP